jgi:hypothetical protein
VDIRDTKQLLSNAAKAKRLRVLFVDVYPKEYPKIYA